jgi:hypothetical protein
MSESPKVDAKCFHADGSPKRNSPPTAFDPDNKESKQDSSFSNQHQELVPSKVMRDSGISLQHGNFNSGSIPSPDSRQDSNTGSDSNDHSNSSSLSVGSNSSVGPGSSSHDSSLYSTTDCPDDTVEGGARRNYKVPVEAKSKDGGGQTKGGKKSSQMQQADEKTPIGMKIRKYSKLSHVQKIPYKCVYPEWVSV